MTGGESARRRPRLLLVRHGKTEWNLEGRYQSRTDLAGDKDCIVDLGHLTGITEQFEVERLVSSPSARARATAAKLQDAFAVSSSGVAVDDRLREYDFGPLEGMSKKEIESSSLGEAYRRWALSPQAGGLDGAETWTAFSGRLSHFLAAVLEEQRTVLAVTHGYTIRGLICVAMELPASYVRRLQVDNSSLTALTWKSGRWTLEALNVHGGPRT